MMLHSVKAGPRASISRNTGIILIASGLVPNTAATLVGRALTMLRPAGHRPWNSTGAAWLRKACAIKSGGNGTPCDNHDATLPMQIGIHKHLVRVFLPHQDSTCRRDVVSLWNISSGTFETRGWANTCRRCLLRAAPAAPAPRPVAADRLPPGPAMRSEFHGRRVIGASWIRLR